MNVSKVLLSGVIALTLVPAAAQAANAAAARTAPISPAAKSLALTTPVRAGAATGKKSHLLGLGVGGALLLTAGVVATAVVIADAVDDSSSG